MTDFLLPSFPSLAYALRTEIVHMLRAVAG